jgi:hypothetical protein
MATTIGKISTVNTILSGSQDQLVVTRDMVRNYGAPEDFIEMHVTDPADKNIFSVVPFTNFTIPGVFQPATAYTVQELIFDPATDLNNLGITFGDYNVIYNILRPKIVKSFNPSLFIKEISGDRTEIRLATNNIDNSEFTTNVIDFINEFQSLPYFKEFYLNFGKNQLLPAINVALDTGVDIINNVGATTAPSVSQTATVLIKLLNPLPLKYKVYDLLTIVDAISNPQIFSASITLDPVPVTFPTLRGPNFDLDLDNLRVGPTPYYNFNQITSFQGNFAPQLQQLLGQLSASNFAINIDYSDYENYIHFSSAARRLEGFKYKLTNIELYASSSASLAASTTPTAQLDAISYQNKINQTIQSFDGWEQYLYYESSSYSWPKQNSTLPYIVQSVTSSESQIWYNGNYSSASLYDDNNQNYLLYALPGYITENDSNELAFKFVASIGQMFDDVWIHIKAISDLYQAKNSLTQGISKDLVYFALQSMGIDVYTNQDGDNVFRYLYGVDENGNYLPNTGSYETLVSASNYQTSGQDIQKGIYKRLYHNLPLLLKSKGTTRFIQYLNTIFGIPSTVMSYIEYGGVDKVTSSFEYEFDRFTYSIQSSGSNYITTPWEFLTQNFNKQGYNDVIANGIEIRFKATPSSSQYSLLQHPTQSIFYQSTGDFSLNLLYTQTGSNDSIYSGSVGDFGYFEFYLVGNSTIITPTIPIFTTGSDNDTSWYSVLVQRRYPNKQYTEIADPQYYDIYIKNNIYGEIGHVASASLYTTNNQGWYSDGGNLVLGGGAFPFSGSYQELRLWSNYISESAFDSHVLNPESIEGNYASSSFDDLAARWSLGNNLYTYNHSITTQVPSTAPDQFIQAFTASFYNFPNQNNYTSFTETYYADVANSGYANPVVDKVRIYSGSEYGTQLMPNKSIEVPPLIPITKDIHLLDASLSPIDEIDRNIISQFGSTYSLDDIIGNPATGSYNELIDLRQKFFKKFRAKYNYKDYIRIIEFFHNSLFRTLKDFTPARTNLSTGIVIKPHLLERPVNQRPEPNVVEDNHIVDIDTAFITGSNGGGYSQSIYDITYTTPEGYVTVLSDARDFFTGEFPSGSIDYRSLFVSGNINPYIIYNPVNDFFDQYSSSYWNHNYNPLLNNVSSSRLSQIRRKSTYITSASKLVQVLEPYSLQDFTYNYIRHSKPRYDGSRTNSTQYNFFLNDDFQFNNLGVGPFGRNSVIDKNTIQFAYFEQAVCTGSQELAARDRANLYLKYIIDENSNLTELISRNYDDIRNNQWWNFYQVQNIFKAGEIANISLFDTQAPTQQRSLNGNKKIFDSGYRYYPILWRTHGEISGSQLYFIPTGYATDGFLTPSNYTVTVTRLNTYITWDGVNTSIEGNVRYTPPGGYTGFLPYDITATVTLDVYRSLSGFFQNNFNIIIDTAIPRLASNGVSPNVTGYFSWRGGGAVSYTRGYVSNARPTAGSGPNVFYTVTDSSPFLTVNSQDKRIVSCSLVMSQRYNDPFTFSGSVIDPSFPTTLTSSIKLHNSYCLPEYPFSINVGDLIRFDLKASPSENSVPTTNFLPQYEYTILNVDTTGSRVTFTLDRPVDNSLTSSDVPYQIKRYIFSKKILDESNVIVIHRKNDGETSGGIVKNQNLSLRVDDNLGNIVSSLKSKIFSTVLTT